MSDGQQELLNGVPDNIWTRLMFNVAQKRRSLFLSEAVEKNLEITRKGGTIWEAVRKADEAQFKRLITEDPSVVDVRGPIGECPIHMLFLYGTETHMNMAQYLITNYPHTLTQKNNSADHYGEIALHIAIIKQNATMVEWLLGDERNEDFQEQQLTATASGLFFQPGRPCYYGEYPLAFACCTNQWKIAEILLSYGASMDAVDSHGNNILHLLVIHNLPKIYTKYKERWIEEQKNEEELHAAVNGENLTKVEEPKAEQPNGEPPKVEPPKVIPLWKRLNEDGYTPLTLAAKLGKSEMFSFLLEERKITQWSYGPVSCVLYPLDQVDLEIQEDDVEKPVGALELIVQNAHAELIMHPRMVDLVTKKWERFARRIFFSRFLVTLSYLLVFLLTTILDQSRTEITEGDGDDIVVTKIEGPGKLTQNICAIGRLFVLAGALHKGRGELNEMSSIGIRKYFQTTGSGLLENCLALLFCIMIYAVNILRMFDMDAQIAALAIASILGWGYVLFFVMAFRITGPFVVMIYQMLFNDVLRFCIIYMVFLAGFSQTFFILFDYNGFGGFLLSVKQCFLGMLGDFDLDAYTDTTYCYVTVSLLIFYIIVVTILLLNLLVAMMGDTYGNIIGDATQVWNLERARIVFAIENEMSTKERDSSSNKYWTNVDNERYLQVEEVNEKGFVGEEGDGDDDDKNDNNKDDD